MLFLAIFFCGELSTSRSFHSEIWTETENVDSKDSLEMFCATLLLSGLMFERLSARLSDRFELFENWEWAFVLAFVYKMSFGYFYLIYLHGETKWCRRAVSPSLIVKGGFVAQKIFSSLTPVIWKSSWNWNLIELSSKMRAFVDFLIKTFYFFSTEIPSCLSEILLSRSSTSL